MKPVGTKPILTERLMLRPLTMNDAEAMFKNWASDPKVTTFLTWPTHTTVEDSKKVIAMWLEAYETGAHYNWGIELKSLGEVIGNISIVKLIQEANACEIGYCIGSAFWNKGIVTEAFHAVIDYLFKEVELNRIAAHHDIKNPASGEVMKKAGLSYEGTLREISMKNDAYVSLAVYAILRKDYLGNPK